MLGSSHAACFSSVSIAQTFKLSIFANRATGLFRNLRLSRSGRIYCDPAADDWDKLISKKSMQLTNSSNCIHDYDAVILNIRYRLPIPFLLNSCNGLPMYPVRLFSKNLLETIIHRHAFDDEIGLSGNKRILQLLSLSGYKGDVLLILTPFATATEVENGENAGQNQRQDKKEILLGLIKTVLSAELKCPILLPSASMLDDFMYAKAKYASDLSSAWRSVIDDRASAPRDKIHKNRLYALDLIKANASLF